MMRARRRVAGAKVAEVPGPAGGRNWRGLSQRGQGAGAPPCLRQRSAVLGRLDGIYGGNPVTMGEMTRHVPYAGSYAPVTLLIQQMPYGGTRVAYDTVASAIAPYHDSAASEVTQRLDTEVLDLLRQVTAAPASASP